MDKEIFAMDKEEFYISAIRFRKRNGVGLPINLFEQSSHYDEVLVIVNELIAEGKIKRVKTYNEDARDFNNWWCLTSGYCIEDDGSSMELVTFVNYYIGNRDSKLFGDDEPTVAELVEQNFLSEYNEWRIKNESELEIMVNMRESYKPEINLDTFWDEFKDFKPLAQADCERIQTLDWYKNNRSVAEVVDINAKILMAEKDILTMIKGMMTFLNKKMGKGEAGKIFDKRNSMETVKADYAICKEEIRFRQAILEKLVTCNTIKDMF